MKKTHKLNEEQKNDICRKYSTGNYTCTKLGNEYNVIYTSISSLLKSRNIIVNNDRCKLHRRYKFNETYFDKIDTEDKAYFLGLLYADGCNITNGIKLSLQSNDIDILDKLNILIGSENTIKTTISKTTNKKNMSHLTIYSQSISLQLMKLGCIPNKSLTLKFPTEEQVPSKLIRHFIRGYFDGDGNIYYKQKSTYFNSRASLVSTEDFCNSVKNLIDEKLIIKCSVRYKSKNNITKQFEITGDRNSIIFLDWIYQNSKIHLDRKYNKYLELKSLVTKTSFKLFADRLL